MPNPQKPSGKFKQLSIESAFGIRPSRPPATSSSSQAQASSSSSGSRPGPVRNTSIGTSSRYFRPNRDEASRTSRGRGETTSLSEEMEGIEGRGKESEDDDIEEELEDAGESQATVGESQATTESQSEEKYVALKFSPPRNEAYAEVAKQNQRISKVLIDYLYHDSDEKPWSFNYSAKKTRLGRSYCPGYRLPFGDLEAGQLGCRIKVIDGDSYDVACELLERHKAEIAAQSQPPDYHDFGPVVLNMANKRTRGGGWLKGCMAQEEELCYRSTLHYSLPRGFYPIEDTNGIYTNYVAIYRTRAVDGHKLYPTAEFIYETSNMDSNRMITSTPPSDPLPVVSVISIAAVRDPEVVELSDGTMTYKNPGDRDLMKTKIRLTLQMAAINGHRRVVLGALGCGAFNNPNLEVMKLFKEVFAEPQFRGGWWKEIVFAVLDTERDEKMKGKNGQGNYGVFYRNLHGVVV